MSKRTAKAKIGKDVFELHEDRRTLLINGVACRIETDDDGFIQVEGPDKVWVERRGYEEAHNWLTAVSKAVGIDVNSLSPNELDQVLAENHVNIVHLVPDGSGLDVSQEEYHSTVIKMDRFVDEFDTGSDGIKAGLKRSALIRKHLMAAKLEERIARGLAKSYKFR